MSATQNDLKQKIASLEKEVSEARRVLHDAITRHHSALCETVPFKTGDIIEHRKILLKVSHPVVRYGSLILVCIKPKSDGSYGKRETALYPSEWPNARLHRPAEVA